MKTKNTIDLSGYEKEELDLYIEDINEHRELALEQIALNEKWLKETTERLAFFKQRVKEKTAPDDIAELETAIEDNRELQKKMREDTATLRESVQTFDGVLKMVKESLDQENR